MPDRFTKSFSWRYFLFEKAIRELVQNKEDFNFILSDLDTDESQFSIEIQLPFILKIFGEDVELVPMYLGEMSLAQSEKLAEVLYDPFHSKDTLFIFVSNLCRWGKEYLNFK